MPPIQESDLAVKEAISAERERCAVIAESYFYGAEDEALGSLIAERIRSGE